MDQAQDDSIHEELRHEWTCRCLPSKPADPLSCLAGTTSKLTPEAYCRKKIVATYSRINNSTGNNKWDKGGGSNSGKGTTSAAEVNSRIQQGKAAMKLFETSRHDSSPFEK